MDEKTVMDKSQIWKMTHYFWNGANCGFYSSKGYRKRNSLVKLTYEMPKISSQFKRQHYWIIITITFYSCCWFTHFICQIFALHQFSPIQEFLCNFVFAFEKDKPIYTLIQLSIMLSIEVSANNILIDTMVLYNKKPQSIISLLSLLIAP